MEHVIPFLRGKYAQAHAMSKSMIHNAFRCLDVNGDGFLTHGELKYVLMNASSHVTTEECTSLIDYLDIDRNGSIDWFEFQKLYDLLHEPDALQELPSLTRLAIKKLQYASLPDPEKYLTMFAGLPANYRLSVLATTAQSPHANLAKIVCPTLCITDDAMPLNLTAANSGSQPNAIQCSIQILRVTGVPTPAPEFRKNIVNRGARISLCRLSSPPSPETGGVMETPKFLGNVAKLHASVDEKTLDMWKFSNADMMDPDLSVFIKCQLDYIKEADRTRGGTRDGSAATDGSDIYLFLELVCTIKVMSKFNHKALEESIIFTNKKRQRTRNSSRSRRSMRKDEAKGTRGDNNATGDSVRNSKDLTPIPKRDRSSSRSRGKENIKADKKDTAAKPEEKSTKKEKSSRGKADWKKDALTELDDALDDSEDEDEESDALPDDDESAPTVEVCCGWIMIPLVSTLQNKSKAKIVLNMSGGSAFSQINIQKEDVPERQGAIHTLLRTVGFKISSKLELLLTSVTPQKADPVAYNLLNILPHYILLPTKATTVAGIYRYVFIRHLLDVQEYGVPNRLLPQSATAAHAGDPVFSSFPRILSDPAASRVLMLLWSRESPKTISTRDGKVSEDAIKVFRDVVLRVWRAFSTPSTQPSRIAATESVHAVYRREMKIRELLEIPLPANSAATVADPKTEGDKEKVITTLEMSRDHTPFNVRELMWGNEEYI